MIRALDYSDASQKAADIIAAQITQKPDTVLGLATGGSPVGIYENLIVHYRNGLDFSQTRTVNLDEYVGLAPDHPQSYAYYMAANLFHYINIAPNNIHNPDGTDTDTQNQCKAYDQIIRSLGGVDMQLLGIGHNGHIGFNEPSTSFTKGTHCVDLTHTTIAANAVPPKATSIIAVIIKVRHPLITFTPFTISSRTQRCLHFRRRLPLQRAW